jgi:hypothetical protein
MISKRLTAAAAAIAACTVAAIGSALAGPLDDEISQVLTTTPGTTYTISFYLAHDFGDAQNDFSVEFGDQTIFSLTNADAFPYTLETLTATATSDSTTLAFLGFEVPAWYGLDDVSVSVANGPNLVSNPGFDADSNVPPAGWTFTPAVVGSFFYVGLNDYGVISEPNSANFGSVGGTVPTVPEPQTWAMMLTGFAGLGLLGYRRARAAASMA